VIDRVVVLNDSTSALGGATGLAIASALAFRARGHPVTFITGDSGANPALEAAGVEIVALEQKRLLASAPAQVLLRGLYNGSAARLVRDWIAERDTPGTVYHLHGWAQIFSPAIFPVLNGVRERLVLSAHDFFLVCPNGSYSFLRTGEICELTPLSLRCIGANCDRRSYAHKLWRVARQAVRRSLFDLTVSPPPVLAIHERMRPFLERGGVPSAAVRALPNPIRPFLDERVAAERNSEFVFIGRLEHGKGPDIACAAARAAGAKLRLIGDGPLGLSLKREYPEVTFSGRLAPEHMAPLVSQARALVMPSRYPEPYGLVATEALWSGLPVILSSSAFLAPEIVGRNAGLACEPQNVAALAAAMERLLTDDDMTAAMSLAAFEQTRDLGSTPEGWIDKLLLTYQERLATRNKPS
jgi:glycosyltransferase involved in cell wall biosynthesis